MSTNTEETTTAIQPVLATELTELAGQSPAERLSALMAHRKLVQRVMAQAMTEGVHYGIIRDRNGKPIHDRPTLYDPGALFMMFIWGLRGLPVFEIAEEDFDPPQFRYVVRYDLYHIKSGLLVGCGYGSANSFEPQWYYRWVRLTELPPGVDPKQLPKKVVKPKSGGQFELYRIINPDLAALQNSIRKQAVVRARRDAVLTVTASKDLFTQDLDEIPLPSEAEDEEIPFEPAENTETNPPSLPTARQAPATTRPVRRRRSPAATATTASTPASPPPPDSPAPDSPAPQAPPPNDVPASESPERPVLPQEWATLINEAAKRGWSHPAMAQVYKQITGKSMAQRPSRQEFERFKQALMQSAPADTSELPF